MSREGTGEMLQGRDARVVRPPGATVRLVVHVDDGGLHLPDFAVHLFDLLHQRRCDFLRCWGFACPSHVRKILEI